MQGEGGGGEGGHCSHMWFRTQFTVTDTKNGELSLFIPHMGFSMNQSIHSIVSLFNRVLGAASAPAVTSRVACCAGSLSSASLKQDLVVASVTWRCYNLPLQKPLTTEAGDGYRRGFILQVQLRQGEALFGGIGEVAPLAGEPLSLLTLN